LLKHQDLPPDASDKSTTIALAQRTGSYQHNHDFAPNYTFLLVESRRQGFNQLQSENAPSAVLSQCGILLSTAEGQSTTESW
jgi:hypothetical protein